MPWERRTVYEQREEFAEAAMECRNFSALCREFGISRRTGYKWLERYKAGMPMTDRSRRPAKSPGKTPPEVEARILAVREDCGWGAKTIHQVLEREGCTELPCIKTVNNILRRNGCIQEEESLKRRPFQRFEKDACNRMWQTDFKGEFRMADGNYCFPLDILDDHFRFLICIKPNLSTGNVVIPTFIEAFRTSGMPDSILSDNVTQFAGFKKGYTQFEKWLMDPGYITDSWPDKASPDPGQDRAIPSDAQKRAVEASQHCRYRGRGTSVPMLAGKIQPYAPS